MWTTAMIKDLRDYWQQGLSASEISLRINVSRNAVIGKAHRIGLPKRDAAALSVTWTKEMADKLTALWKMKVSLAEIGRQIGVSADAVRNKAVRMGLRRF